MSIIKTATYFYVYTLLYCVLYILYIISYTIECKFKIVISLYVNNINVALCSICLSTLIAHFNLILAVKFHTVNLTKG